MLDYLQELNEEQRIAVEDTEGPSLIIAGAGSGKTRVLTYRIAHLLNLGRRPSKILALTFTNKAAREMKSRIAALTDEKLSNYLWMGTFHSIFAKILRIEHKHIGFPSDYTIYDTQDTKNLIKTVIKELKLDPDLYKPKEAQGRISWAKNNLITPELYENNEEIQEQDLSRRQPFLNKIYRLYVKRCFKAGAMDFDDLLLQTNILLRDHKDVLEKYQKRFHYILVDEYQDTNHAQYIILKKLAAAHQNICVVGDDAQSIYGFRGARIENILNFRNDYPNYNLYKLERNYRSTQTIVNAANSVIAKNERRIPKNIYSKEDVGASIRLQPVISDTEEGFWVVDDIHHTHLREHDNYADFAILYRTNAQSRIFEDALRKKNIPYKIYGGLSFYQRKEVKDLLAYLRVVVNPGDDEALKRIINYPKRGIGKSTLDKLQQQAFANGLNIWQVMTSESLAKTQLNKRAQNKLVEFAELIRHFQEYLKENAYNAAKKIAAETGLLKELYQDKSPEGISRHENVQELLNGIYTFVKQRKNMAREEADEEDAAAQGYTLEHYLENVALLTTQDEGNDQVNKVTLMTIHSAKGLEFRNLYIVGLEEDLFPFKMAVNTANELEEERRLFYVAMTRAQHRLTLTYARQRFKWGTLIPTTPSRFVNNIDTSFLDMPEDTGPPPGMQSAGGTRYVRHRTASNGTSEKSVKQQAQTQAGDMLSQVQKGKYKKINKSQKQKETDPTEYRILAAEELQIGTQVEHSRFGKGRVTEITGTYPQTRALIDFEQKGKKQLLLKFARLKIIE